MKWENKRRRPGAIALLVILALACAGLALYLGVRAKPAGRPDAAPGMPDAGRPPGGRAVTEPFRHLVFPTDQVLDCNDPDAFQPTASGRPESALFGSVRTVRSGKGLAASFHEGVDIAADQRDERGLPQDAVYAVADGAVAYVNDRAGNSNYGKYVVLAHACPSGTVYTLYAHLAESVPALVRGLEVKAGDVLGIVGRTGNPPIPLERAHLHFEIGLMLNARLSRWFRAHKLDNYHGNFNGWNLLGVDPLAVFERRRQCPAFDFFRHIAALPAAFEIVLAARRCPDFFSRYACLWEGAPYRGAGLQMAVTENGLPLKGRNATEAEGRQLGARKSAVVRVDPDVLGRNGRRLVICRNGRWRLGRAGEKWRDMLLYY